jgi:hypothetical protein
MTQDPTRGEMETALAPLVRQWEADKMDVQSAIHWFATNHYGGKSSNLYEALSSSKYKPGMSEYLPDGVGLYLYEALEDYFQ